MHGKCDSLSRAKDIPGTLARLGIPPEKRLFPTKLLLDLIDPLAPWNEDISSIKTLYDERCQVFRAATSARATSTTSYPLLTTPISRLSPTPT
jgi:hypothetical protein